jgi:hypothetical protein
MTPTPQAGFRQQRAGRLRAVDLRMVPIFRTVLRLLAASERLADERWAVSLHDLYEFTMIAYHPVNIHFHGDYLGSRTSVRF